MLFLAAVWMFSFPLILILSYCYPSYLELFHSLLIFYSIATFVITLKKDELMFCFFPFFISVGSIISILTNHPLPESYQLYFACSTLILCSGIIRAIDRPSECEGVYIPFQKKHSNAETLNRILNSHDASNQLDRFQIQNKDLCNLMKQDPAFNDMVVYSLEHELYMKKVIDLYIKRRKPYHPDFFKKIYADATQATLDSQKCQEYLNNYILKLKKDNQDCENILQTIRSE